MLSVIQWATFTLMVFVESTNLESAIISWITGVIALPKLKKRHRLAHS